MELEQSIPLYNTQGASKTKSIQGLYATSRNVQAIMDIKYVMCEQIMLRCEDESDTIEIQLEMSTEDERNQLQCVV